MPRWVMMQAHAETSAAWELASCSFDHPVRLQTQLLRNRNSKRSRRPAIDDERELRGLLDGQLRRFCALENLVHVRGCAPVEVYPVRSVRQQATLVHIFTIA